MDRELFGYPHFLWISLWKGRLKQPVTRARIAFLLEWAFFSHPNLLLNFNDLQYLYEARPENPCETQENKGAGLKMCISFSCQVPFQHGPICFSYRFPSAPPKK